MLYRIHDKLLIAKEGVFIQGGNGCVHTLSMLSPTTRAVLVKVGAISEVQAPPLSILWGDVGRARKMADLGIDTIGLVTMEAKDAAYAIRASERDPGDDPRFNERVDKLALAVERWQAEIREHLGIGSAEVRR